MVWMQYKWSHSEITSDKRLFDFCEEFLEFSGKKSGGKGVRLDETQSNYQDSLFNYLWSYMTWMINLAYVGAEIS